jgi:hypothetical protein
LGNTSPARGTASSDIQQGTTHWADSEFETNEDAVLSCVARGRLPRWSLEGALTRSTARVIVLADLPSTSTSPKMTVAIPATPRPAIRLIYEAGILLKRCVLFRLTDTTTGKPTTPSSHCLDVPLIDPLVRQDDHTTGSHRSSLASGSRVGPACQGLRLPRFDGQGRWLD